MEHWIQSLDGARPEAVTRRGRPRAGRGLRGLLPLLGVSGALLAAGCGGDSGDNGGDSGDKKAACDKIMQELQRGSTAPQPQGGDPAAAGAAAAASFRERASAIRSAGVSSGDAKVKAAAERTASSLEEGADAVESAASGGTPQFPTTDPRQQGMELKEACS